MGGKRKIIVFAVCLLCAMISPSYMPIEYYKEFVSNLVWLAAGFFAGNALSNATGRIMTRRGSGPESPGGAL